MNRPLSFWRNKATEESLLCKILQSNSFANNYLFCAIESFWRCAGVTFGAKVTKTWALRLAHTLTLHSVWYASSATNRGNFSLPQNFSRFSQAYRHLSACTLFGWPWLSACSPQTQPFILGEKYFPEPLSVYTPKTAQLLLCRISLPYQSGLPSIYLATMFLSSPI